MTLGAGAPGPLALVGSGEFTPAMEVTDARLLAGRPARVAVLPTAASTEGDHVVRRWLDLAHAHYARLGAEVVELDVRTAADAADPAHVAAVDGCGLVYLSGGRPDHLVATLADTALLAAVLAAWRGGAALAGCSAGAMALANGWPPILRARGAWGTGFGVLPALGLVPHHDRYVGWRPRYAQTVAAQAPDGWRVLGIDEDTALVHEAGTWRVEGVAGVWWLTSDGPQGFAEHPPPATPGGPARAGRDGPSRWGPGPRTR